MEYGLIDEASGTYGSGYATEKADVTLRERVMDEKGVETSFGGPGMGAGIGGV